MYFTENDLCDFLNVTKVFLYRCRQKGMPFIRLGSRLIRYDLEEVLNWINSNSVSNFKG